MGELVSNIAAGKYNIYFCVQNVVLTYDVFSSKDTLHGCKTVRKVLAPVLMVLYNCVRCEEKAIAHNRLDTLVGRDSLCIYSITTLLSA